MALKWDRAWGMVLQVVCFSHQCFSPFCRRHSPVPRRFLSVPLTIETRIRHSYALARQWFGVNITPEASNDEWLLDGLAGFLTDTFIRKYLGNNEAHYRRYKANVTVCQADDSGATVLSSAAASKDLYGTQCIGFYGKVRSWKSKEGRRNH